MNVSFPQFELVGPPCPAIGCQGVLIPCIRIKDRIFRDCCSQCKRGYNEAPLREKIGYALRTIERALKGEKGS